MGCYDKLPPRGRGIFSSHESGKFSNASDVNGVLREEVREDLT